MNGKRVTEYIAKRFGLLRALVALDLIFVAFSVFAYVYLLYSAYCDGLLLLLETVAVTAVPFVLVSLLRILVDAKRPYEEYGINMPLYRHRGGRSFPSRHAFSSSLIAVCVYPYAPWLTLALCIVSVLLSVIRCLIGLHYIRDVVAGIAIGAVSGVIGIMIFSLA